MVHGGDGGPGQLGLGQVQTLHQVEARVTVVAPHHVQLAPHRRRRHVAPPPGQTLQGVEDIVKLPLSGLTVQKELCFLDQSIRIQLYKCTYSFKAFYMRMVLLGTFLYNWALLSAG